MKRRFSSLDSDGQDVEERRPCKSQWLWILCTIRDLKKKVNLCNERARTLSDFQTLVVKMKPEISLLRHKLDELASAINKAAAKWSEELGGELVSSTLVKMKYEISVMMSTIDELPITGKKLVAIRDDEKHRAPQFNRPPIIWNIPYDILRKLTEYLNEDELFEVRGVHRIFYRAFYELRLGVETQTAFNFHRAKKLAQMGRVFKNVEFFYWEMNVEDGFKIPECLNPLNFPALYFLEINGTNSVDPENISRCSEDEDKPSHPNIRTVQIVNCHAELLTDERFPNLKQLICIGKVQLQGCRLSKLQLIKFHDIPRDFGYVSRENFPSLQKVVFNWNVGITNEGKKRLREAGISVLLTKPQNFKKYF